MKQIRKRLTYANVMSSIAVFLILGGATALAASQLGKNSVGTKQLKKNSVTSAKIKKDAITGAKVKDGSLTGADINSSTLGKVPNATNADHATNAASAGAVTAGAVTPAGLSQIPAARVYNSASQSLPNNTDVTLNFDTESFDTDNLHSTTPDSSKLTAPIAGIYRVSSSVGFTVATGRLRLELLQNGTIVLYDTQNPTTGDNTFLSATDLVQLKAGEFVQVVVQQTSGATSSAFSCGPPGSCPTFSMEWVAPS